MHVVLLCFVLSLCLIRLDLLLLNSLTLLHFVLLYISIIRSLCTHIVCAVKFQSDGA